MPQNPATITAFYTDTKRVLRLEDCCSALRFQSTYPGTQIPPSDEDYITTLELFIEDCCGRRECLSVLNDIPVNTEQVYDQLSEDNKYVLVITFTANDGTIYETELCVEATCCDDKRNDLVCQIKKKMAEISCKINDNKVIGRSTTKLEKNYLKLSNYLYLLNSCSCIGKIKLTCTQIETIRCGFKKIK